MKNFKYLFIVLGLSAFIACNSEHSNDSNDLSEHNSLEQSLEIYQLKIYSCETDEQVLDTEHYLKQAFLPGLKRMGISQVGVLKPRVNVEEMDRRIFVLIPFNTLDDFYTLDAKLKKDEQYVLAGEDYLNAAHDQPPYSRIESILLKAFSGMPSMKAPELDGNRKDRVYELRSYQSATEAIHAKKVDMFNAGGEIKLFEKLEFNAVFYAQVIAGSDMPNLMYMITFSDEESQKAHWSTFVNSPEWSELKVMPKYANTVSHIDKYLLYPTDYSDY